ncbi:MAG TPA: CoA transferase [Pseudomonadales bacterium]|jgi:crotonobetainyl-CoA:carnitine CoA-transferase CaiB-like acyl-CoA transferase
MSGPLEGFKVIDLSAVVSGPLTGALLADLGADVIKVERTVTGDIQRNVGSRRNGFSGFFHVLNRGKRSIALNLTTREGCDIVHRLSADADVVLQNFRPGVVERLGIDYARLCADNPGLVYLSISGFGQSGPRAKDRAYDPIIQAYAGITDVQGSIHRDNPDQPEQVNMLLLDKLTAWTGCQAIMAALLARSRTGKGQHVELSMLDTAISFIWSDVAADLILQGDDVDRRPPIRASGTMQTYADGHGFTMTLSQPEFEGLCRAYGLDHIAEDARFASLDLRMRHRAELREIISSEVDEVALELTVAQAEERLLRHEVPFARVRRLADLPEDEQIQHNQMFRELNHPVAGPLRDARPAPRFASTPAEPGGPAPSVGEHTRQILEEISMGAETEKLFERGIVS